MRAVILATGLFQEDSSLGDARAVGMQTVAGKPWIQHVVEVLVNGGVAQIELVLWHQAHRYESLLGDGTRWGVEVQYHFAHSPEEPLACLKGLEREGPVFLVSESALPLDTLRSDDEHLTLHDEQRVWVGSVLPWSSLQAHLSLPWSKLATELPELDGESRETRVLPMREPNDVLQANRYFLEGGEGLFAAGREVEPGVWIGRNVLLHPTAKITPPVYLGPHSRIGARAEIGPYGSLGEHCFLGARTKVANSVIQNGSFLGEDLELVDSLSDRDFIYQIPLAVRIPIVDDDIAGRAREGFGGLLYKWGQRALAIGLLILFSPLILSRSLHRRIRSKSLLRVEYVSQPTVNDPVAWQLSFRWREDSPEPTSLKAHFWHDFLPGLPDAAKGSIAVVGSTPRTERELEELPSDWRARVLVSQVGLVTEALAFYGVKTNDDEQYLCEAYFAENRSLGRVLALLLRYLAGVLMEPPR